MSENNNSLVRKVAKMDSNGMPVVKWVFQPDLEKKYSDFDFMEGAFTYMKKNNLQIKTVGGKLLSVDEFLTAFDNEVGE